MRLGERRGDVGDVPDAEGDRVGVEAPVGEAQRLGILLAQTRPSMPRFFARSTPTSSMSGLMSATVTSAPRRGHAEGDVAGAAGHVEDRLARARPHPADEARPSTAGAWPPDIRSFIRS